MVLVAIFASPKRTEGESNSAAWTFEPFSKSARVTNSVAWLRATPNDTFEGQILPDSPSKPAAQTVAAVSGNVRGNTTASAELPYRPRISSYTVQRGDTISGIARAYGVSTQSVMWANHKSDGDLISPGDRIRIPPGTGVLHTVQPGETLEGIAAKYSVTVKDITGDAFNVPENGVILTTGRELFVPGGVMPQPKPVATAPPAPVVAAAPAPVPTARPIVPQSAAPVVTPEPKPLPAAPALASLPGGKLSYPVAGQVGQLFSSAHRGIDILSAMGNPVYASGDGTVQFAEMGWNGGFGNLVEINHGGGIVTRYAHLSVIGVSEGQKVTRGQLLGRVGQTGIATAPHVHFEVLVNGNRSDPMPYLR